MTYREAIERLNIPAVCLGGCGLSPRAHRGYIDGFGIIHFGDRRFTRRGLRRLLLLAARREREGTALAEDAMPVRGFLNDSRQFGWLYGYLDERKANEWADQLGLRFPIAYSRTERLRSFLLLPPGTSKRHPAVWQWARRGWT